MSDLAKRGWGDVPGDELTEARGSGSRELVSAAEEKERSRLRLWMRKQFETDANTREILLAASPAAEAKPLLLEMYEPQAREGGLLSQVLDEMLAELEEQRAAEPGMYLVDAQTGRSVMRLREEAIYQPPDYIGEDGLRHRARPMLHPGISAPLAMRAHEDGRLAEALGRPGAATALQVLRRPESIVEVASEKLREMGFDVGPVPEGTQEDVEVGREYYDPLQSQNEAFHRHAVFGAVLAKKVSERMEGSRRCELLPAVLERNSKQRWYRVAFRRA